MRWIIILTIVLLAGCAQQVDESPHGTIPTDEPNLPSQNGDMEVSVSDVNYFEDVTGYEAMPTEEGDYPGIVMIHEWWGLNDNIRSMAEELAAHGYHVLAVDLFEGSVAATPAEAREQVGNFDAGKGIANLQAAEEYLREQGSERVASLGWCFGGGQSLAFAQASELDATVIYYGTVTGDQEELSTVNEPILGIFGEEDTSIPVSDVNEFDEALSNRSVEHEIFIYPGAEHAFANPSGDRYNQEAAEDAWRKTLDFLREELKQED